MRFREVTAVGFALLLSWAPGARAEAEFSFASLQEIIQTHDVRSVDDLIAALPTDLRSHYALVFDSRSLQGASFDAPRVIAYGAEARFVLTFNGNPDQRGFQAVETLEFDSERKEFHFREIQFRPRTDGPSDMVLSAVNPEKCAGCHGVPAKPIWDTYPVWPGAYGERYGEKLSAEETRGLATFLKRQPTDTRYKHLLNVDRFSNPETFHPTAKTFYSAAAPEPPNAELSVYLSRLEFQAVARRLVRQPEFPAYRFALLGVVDDDCGGLSEFYPESQWPARAASFDKFVSDTKKADLRQLQSKLLRLEPSARRLAVAELTPDVVTLTKFRFIAESSLGVSATDWSLALEQATYDFSTLPSRTSPLRQALLSEMAYAQSGELDSEISGNPLDGNRYCEDLQRKSRRALTELAARESASHDQPGAAKRDAVLSAGPPAVQVCVGCHQTEVAPWIPFSDPVKLASELRTRPSVHGRLIDEVRFRLSTEAGAKRMPLGINLSDDERRQLNAYFSELAAAD